MHPDPMVSWLTDAFAGGPAAVASKGFIILAVAVGGSYLIRRAPAATRHLYWTAALVAALAMPIATQFMPAFDVPLLPVAEPFENGEPSFVGAASVGSPALESAEGIGTRSSDAGTVEMEGRGGAEIPWSELTLVVWLVGAGWIVLRAGTDSIRAVVLIRRASPVSARAWLDSLDEISDRLNLRRRVRLVQSAEIDIPFTWGAWRPVVAVPAGADEWTQEKRRCVLAHELSHVKRMDTVTQLLASAACAVHWFNPLAWRADAQMRVERERACDAAVLEMGQARPSAYAEYLMEIALAVNRPRPTPAIVVAMASRSHLEGRVLSILQEVDNAKVRPRAALATGLAAVFLLVILGGMRLGPTGDAAAADNLPVQTAPTASVQAATALPVQAPSETENQAPSVSATQGAPATAAATPVPSPPGKGTADDVIRRTFDVAPGGRLVIDTDMGNIRVETANQNKVDIEVRRRTRGSAREEDLEVSFEQEGNVVTVRGERTRRRDSWRDGLGVDFVVIVPSRFDVDLNTSGGNIAIEDLDGRADVETAGGNLSFGRISGRVLAHTSGGNISIDGSDGDVEVSTSGGNVSLGRVAGTVDVRTSGGNISVDEVGGDIRAVTSGGQIVARIAAQPEGDCLLKTSGGSIKVFLAEGISVDLDAETSAGRVETDIEVLVQGRLERDRLRGTINGGGPKLELDTSAGDVDIRRM